MQYYRSLFSFKVTHLVIRRPANFLFHPGDWIFIKIPAIAKMEWHPFTISSAPENRQELTLHIRSAGSWTNRLYDYFDNYDKGDGEGGFEAAASADVEAPDPFEKFSKANSSRGGGSIKLQPENQKRKQRGRRESVVDSGKKKVEKGCKGC